MGQGKMVAQSLSKTPKSLQKVQITELTDFSELLEISEPGNPGVFPQISKTPRCFRPYCIVFRELHPFPKLRYFTSDTLIHEPLNHTNFTPDILILDILPHIILISDILTPDIFTLDILIPNILTPYILLRYNNVCRRLPPNNKISLHGSV